MKGMSSIAVVACLLLSSCSTSSHGPGSVMPQDAAKSAGAAAADATAATPGNTLAAVVPSGAVPLVDRARLNLQDRRAVGSASDVRVLSVEEMDWPDPGLDCPDPELRFAPASTPGYRIALEAGGRTYEYHTDTSYSIVLCDEGQPVRGFRR